MSGERSIHLREVGDEWVAVEEGTDEVGRGQTAQRALADLEGDAESTPASSTGELVDPIKNVSTGSRMPTISPKIELLFAVAAIGGGGIYIIAGNVSGAVLLAIGIALLVRVAWIEYGLFGPKQ